MAQQTGTDFCSEVANRSEDSLQDVMDFHSKYMAFEQILNPSNAALRYHKFSVLHN